MSTTLTPAAAQILSGDSGLTARLAIPAGTDPAALAGDAHLLVLGAIGIIDSMEEAVDGLRESNALWGAKLLLLQAAALMGAGAEGAAE